MFSADIDIKLTLSSNQVTLIENKIGQSIGKILDDNHISFTPIENGGIKITSGTVFDENYPFQLFRVIAEADKDISCEVFFVSDGWVKSKIVIRDGEATFYVPKFEFVEVSRERHLSDRESEVFEDISMSLKNDTANEVKDNISTRESEIFDQMFADMGVEVPADNDCTDTSSRSIESEDESDDFLDFFKELSNDYHCKISITGKGHNMCERVVIEDGWVKTYVAEITWIESDFPDLS